MQQTDGEGCLACPEHVAEGPRQIRSPQQVLTQAMAIADDIRTVSPLFGHVPDITWRHAKAYRKEFRDDITAVARQVEALLRHLSSRSRRVSHLRGCLSNWMKKVVRTSLEYKTRTAPWFPSHKQAGFGGQEGYEEVLWCVPEPGHARADGELGVELAGRPDPAGVGPYLVAAVPHRQGRSCHRSGGRRRESFQRKRRHVLPTRAAAQSSQRKSLAAINPKPTVNASRMAIGWTIALGPSPRTMTSIIPSLR